jgi:uncharacterized membrane protein YfhO
VLTDLFYPGWKAFSGGRELPIYRANALFRAVFLPAGTHEVEFHYRPASFAIGVSVSVATGSLVVVAALINLWRRPPRRLQPPESEA